MHWLELLRQQFPEPAFHVLEQVRNGTGYQRSPRTADAIVIGTWPSRGLELIGVEVKSYRGDWTKELKDPAKAEEIAQYCDRWFLIATDDKIVRDGEIPKQWGYMLVNEQQTKLKIVKPAPDFEKPKPVDRLFLAAIVRAARTNVVSKSEVERLVQAEVTRGIENDRQVGQARIKHLEAEIQRINEQVQAFEREAGVAITDRWNGHVHAARLGRLLKILRNGGFTSEVDRARVVMRQLDGMRDRLEQFVTEFAPMTAVDGQ